MQINFWKQPSSVLSEMNFITDYNPDGLARENVMKKIGTDLLPDYVSKDMPLTELNNLIFKIIKKNF